ncbi:MAG: hypothetical protein AB1331_02010 [Bacillota bacterium]
MGQYIIVSGIYCSEGQVERAVERLVQQGVNRDRISLLGPGTRRKDDSHWMHAQNVGESMTGVDQEIGDGLSAGAVIGGLAGLVLGAAGAVPGISWLLAAGPLAGILSGAVAGGVIGGLVDLGIPHERSSELGQEVARGRIVAAVQTDTIDRTRVVAAILSQTGAERVQVD